MAMQINKISQMMQGELRKTDGGRKPDKWQHSVNAGVTDRSELSADGKKQREIRGDVQIISAMVAAQPDVRAEKVADARMKIDTGFYNTAAFAEKLAEKLAATTFA